MNPREPFVVDSNIIIYAARPDFAHIREYVEANAPIASAISYIEAMGFYRLSAIEQTALEKIFSNIKLMSIDDRVVNEAVKLRRQQKISLGDSVVAATALIHGFPLVTRNVHDFRLIDGLVCVNPFDTTPDVSR